MGASGEYSSSYDWPVAVFSTPEAAQACVDVMTAYVKAGQPMGRTRYDSPKLRQQWEAYWRNVPYADSYVSDDSTFSLAEVALDPEAQS